MLHYLMGDNDFWKAMHLYITENEFKPVVTGDLIHSINEVYNDPLLDRVPKDFTWFFNEWIYKAAQPEYKVSYDYNEKQNQVILSVQQVQKPDSLMGYFKIPIPVEVVTEKSKLEYTVTCDSVPKTYTFTLMRRLNRLYLTKAIKFYASCISISRRLIGCGNCRTQKMQSTEITAINGLKDFI